jgi:hypothetical protein
MFPDHELAAIAAAAHEVGLSLSLPAGALIQPSLRRRDGCDGCARGGGVTPGPARPPPALEEECDAPLWYHEPPPPPPPPRVGLVTWTKP